MPTNNPSSRGGSQPEAAWRDVPIDWDALEDAFENNAPEVHSYLHVPTGDVLRIVDGVADPQMHARIASDINYLRVEPVSSREQYRWMERYIPMVDAGELQSKLGRAIDGKGAFRRFKDVLMGYGPERERWFAFRSERLRIFMEAWLNAHALNPVQRVAWAPSPSPEASESSVEAVAVEAIKTPSRSRSGDVVRQQLHEVVDSLAQRDLDQLMMFADFLRFRRHARPSSSEQTQGQAAKASADQQPDTAHEKDEAPESARVPSAVRKVSSASGD
jgi:hypothetical protein